MAIFKISNPFQKLLCLHGDFTAATFQTRYFLRTLITKFLRLIHLIVPFIFDFDLSINIGTENTNLDLFDPFLGWWPHHEESKLQNFEILVSKTDTSTQIYLYSWLSSFYHHWYVKYISGPNFELMSSQWESKVQYFEKVISEINFPLQSLIRYWFWSFYHPRCMITTLNRFYPI